MLHAVPSSDVYATGIPTDKVSRAESVAGIAETEPGESQTWNWRNIARAAIGKRDA